jgi:hypothetical protein
VGVAHVRGHHNQHADEPIRALPSGLLYTRGVRAIRPRNRWKATFSQLPLERRRTDWAAAGFEMLITLPSQGFGIPHGLHTLFPGLRHLFAFSSQGGALDIEFSLV